MDPVLDQFDFKDYFYSIRAAELTARADLVVAGKTIKGNEGDFLIYDPITQEQDIVKKENFMKILENQYNTIKNLDALKAVVMADTDLEQN